MEPTLRERKQLRTRTAISAAALRLFAERGFGAVSMADVAAAADVGQRTVYRHFADKEELLFGDDEAFAVTLAEALAARPAEEPPVAAVAAAARAVAAQLGDRRAELQTRATVIAATPALQQRDRAKQARFEALVADGLVARGTAPAAARLGARLAVACFDEALAEWIAKGRPGLGVRFDRKLAAAAELFTAR